MPFVSEAYLKYLEEQFQQASGATGGQEEGDLPPPATGPGSNPWNYSGIPDQSWQPGATPSPVVQQPTMEISAASPPNAGGIATPGLTPGLGIPTTPPGTPDFPGSNTPAAYDQSNDELPEVVATPGQDDTDDRANTPFVNRTAHLTPWWANSGNTPGWLPSFYPAGVGPFTGLPPGFTESNRFGGGAPIFTPPGFSGPQWNPGGSIFGGRGNPITPGTYVGAVGGSPSPINVGALPNSWANAIGLNLAASNYNGPLSRAQYKRAMEAAIAANQARASGSGPGHIAGGGSQFRGTAPTTTQ